MKSFIRNAVAASVAVVAMAGFASAQAATVSAQISGNTYTKSSAGAGTYNFTFDKFDSALGTLTSVQYVFSLSTAAGSIGQADNESGAESGNVTFAFSANSTLSAVSGITAAGLVTDAFGNLGTASITDSSILFLDVDDGDPSGSPTTVDNDGGADYASYVSQVQTSTAGSGFVNTTFGGVSQYVGTGTETFTIAMNVGTNFSATGLGSISSSTSPMFFSSAVDVVYTYTPTDVPEPSSSLGVMVAGLMGFAALRRRKTMRAA